jgi:hypothetical protein
MPRRFKPCGLIDCADMKMRFRRQALTLASQGGPAPGAEAAPHARRRIELRDLALGYHIGVAPECREHGHGRAAMLATALAMAPRHPFRFTGGYKSHRAAQAAAFNLIAHGSRLALPGMHFTEWPGARRERIASGDSSSQCAASSWLVTTVDERPCRVESPERAKTHGGG